MDQIATDKFISQQLLYLIAGRRCCQQFACPFRSDEHNIIVNSARSLGLHSQYILNNGHKCVKVFKRCCRHFLADQKSLKLSYSTKMDMFTLLTCTTILEKDVQQADEDYIGNNWSIKVPSLYIPSITLDQPTDHIKEETHWKFLANTLINPCQYKIVESICNNRVTVFDGKLSLDKSICLPLNLLRDSKSKNSNLKIICIEKENIVAIYNCERFAACLGENIGETVGIQVPQHSRISSVTHVVYTTAKYFLRSMFNKGSNKLKQFSHFVINDVHLHNPYTDILLYELKQALTLDHNLKIILLSQACDAEQFVYFFGEGTNLNLDPSNLFDHHISYLEDIQSNIVLAGIHKGSEVYKKQLQLFRNKNQRNEQIDKCLQAYEELGTDLAFHPFLYSINYELIPVNYRHSVTGKTAIFIASQLGNVNHLRLLLYMGSNPYISDEQHENALTIAALNGNKECIDILNNFGLHGYVATNIKPEFVHFDVIMDIMYLLSTQPDYKPGNILIIMPTYYHLVKLNYMLLSNLLAGKFYKYSIYLLHENMEKEYLDSLVKAPTNTLKVVLATEIIESLPLPVSFKYLIDTACQKKTLHDVDSCSTENRYEWVAKDCLLRRTLILDIKASAIGKKFCFRLITKETYKMLSTTSRPDLQTMYLDKICLTVKLLSPKTIISEYLTNTIAPPPLINVHQTVQFLKKIDVLDEFEDVTWLGCRLIDVPVPCQLGRSLIFGILLRCLDPILTIVSSLTTTNPLSIPLNEDIDCIWDRFTIYIQNRIKTERSRLAENQLSDHLIFVRLFQEWQNQLKEDNPPLYLTDEYEFVLNGLMEQINFTRTKIVSALRAANLIHSQGQLSIHSINMKSDSWPLVKAALTGGMYPNICAVDPKNKCVNSAHSLNVHLHPNSVLRDFLSPFKISAQRIYTQWVVCTKQKNNIKYATAVLPLAVAMFAGSSELGLGQILDLQQSSDKTNINFFIDEWIWIVVSKSDCELVLKTRQYFFKMYQYFLKYCNQFEKWRTDSTVLRNHLLLFDTLTTIFENEDEIAGFKKCSNIGFRPALKLPNLYILTVISHFTWNQEIDDKTATTQGAYNFNINSQIVEKHFFLVYSEDNANIFYKKSGPSNIKSAIGRFAQPIDSPSRNIYVILYSKDPDIMFSICQAKIQNDELILKEYFRNAIPLYEIVKACASINVNAPNFASRLTSTFIDKRIGYLIMDLFAFRNHWIHTK